MKYDLTGEFLAGRLRHRLAEEDLQTLEAAMGDVAEYHDGSVLRRAGDALESSMLLLDGIVLQAVYSDGRRYIVGLHVPGDFIDLHSFALQRLDHDLVACGPVRVASVTHEALQTAVENRPKLGRALWFATLLDASIHRKWIQNLEQLDAPRRIAHLFSELHTRLTQIGRDQMRVMRTPFTQQDLADMTGVSAIHANRAVGRLRELGLADVRRGDVYASNWTALKQFARFESGYLYGEGSLQTGRAPA